VNGPVETQRRDREFPSAQIDAAPTFRDPAGCLWLSADYALRRIRPEAVEETETFLASPLRAALERSGDLIRSEIAEPAKHSFVQPGELWLKHPRIDPISYPWEWTPAQWRAAAELTLRVAVQAIDAGWMLKDATPLNILFKGARPVLVDALSFERRDPQSSVWLAYGQFVRTFLLPLIAAQYLSWPLNATLFVRDGYEPGQIYAGLRPWQRLNPNLFDIITLATLLEHPGRKQQTSQKPTTVSDPALAAHILRKRIARLGRQIRHTVHTRNRSKWSDYPQSATHYQPADHADKQEFVKNVLQRSAPQRVLDIGANTGTYAMLAADSGAEVVAIDTDAAALEKLWLAAKRQQRPITTIVANIARPTPSAGWRNREQLSLLDRLTGNFDLVLMLAVIHHLILREQLPLAHIGELCGLLTKRWLVVEWVPPTDPMYQEWLRGRDDLYGKFNEGDLLRAFMPWFSVSDRTELNNGRVLFLLERIEDRPHSNELESNALLEAGPA
jgi:SAM-dependent methyltransferase